MLTCPICGDKGMVRVCYHDGSPDEFGVCLCYVGMRMRNARTVLGTVTTPLFHLWAAREHVDLDQVAMVEDLVDEDELSAIPQGTVVGVASIIAAAMATKRPR